MYGEVRCVSQLPVFYHKFHILLQCSFNKHMYPIHNIQTANKLLYNVLMFSDNGEPKKLNKEHRCRQFNSLRHIINIRQFVVNLC